MGLAADGRGFTRIRLGQFSAFGVFAAVCVVGLRAEVDISGPENVDAASRLGAMCFAQRHGPVRRPPKETRAELTKLIAAAPNDAELYSLRALEDEQQLDFTAAEADWKKYVEVAADKGAARVALADFYHRRLQSNDEFNALMAARRGCAGFGEIAAGFRTKAVEDLSSGRSSCWTTAGSIRCSAVDQYAAWIARYPAETNLYRDFFDSRWIISVRCGGAM